MRRKILFFFAHFECRFFRAVTALSAKDPRRFFFVCVCLRVFDLITTLPAVFFWVLIDWFQFLAGGPSIGSSDRNAPSRFCPNVSIFFDCSSRLFTMLSRTSRLFSSRAFFLLCSLSLSLYFAAVLFCCCSFFPRASLRCSLFCCWFFLGRWWLHGLIDRRHIMRRDIKIVFFGVLPSLIGVFFLWPSASVHLLFTVQSKDQKLTTKNGQSKYRETRYTFHAFGFFILCFVLETSAHFKFSFQTI